MDGIFSNDEEFDDDESDSSSDSDDEDQENLLSTVVAICIRNERTGQDSVYLTLLDSGTNGVWEQQKQYIRLVYI
jgi:hypothetical protein